MMMKLDMDSSASRYARIQAAGTEWALPSSAVVEVLPLATLDRAPGSPKALAGFLNLGGEPLPVIHLAALFGHEPTSGEDLYRHIVRLAPSAGRAMGLLVDRVTDIDLAAEGLAPLDETQSVNGALAANLIVQGQLIPLLDIERLLLVEEQQRIESLTAAARERLASLDQADA